jgi:hypothetical protein
MRSAGLLIALNLLVASAPCAAAESDTFARMRSLVIGSWTNDPEEKPPRPAFVETFKADGTFELFIYESNDCKNVRFSAAGKWILMGNKLGTQTLEVSNSNTPLRPGMRLADDILEVSDEALTLQTKSGRILNRRRGRPCPQHG